MSQLSGRTVVVTRATDQAGSLSTALADHGAKVVELPVVSIEESAAVSYTHLTLPTICSV